MRPRPVPRSQRRRPLVLAITLALPVAGVAQAQIYPLPVIVSGTTLDYEQYYDGNVVPVGVIQGNVTIHPVPDYPAQLGGAGISVFRGAVVTIDPTAGTPGAVRVTSDYRSGAPNDALYIANGTVHIVDSPGRVWLTGNGQTVHGLYMPESAGGPSLLDGGGITITTTGIKADGIRLYGANSTVDIGNTEITVNGGNGTYNPDPLNYIDDRSWGLLSWGGSNATLTNSAITGLDPTKGGGVRVYNGSSATLNGNSTINTTGGTGLLAEAAGTLRTNADPSISGTVAVTTSGTEAHGVRIGNATGNLNRLSISTTGNNARGLYTSGTTTATSAVTGSQVAVTTQGSGAYGIWTSGSSTLDLSGGSITTQGASAYGVLSGSGAANVTLRDFSIATHGSQAYGLYAWTSSSTTLAGGSISTDQASTYGIYANAGTANLLRDAGGTGTSITTSGANAYAVRIQNGGSFNAAGANLHSVAAGIVFDAPQVLTITPVLADPPSTPPLPPTTPEQPPGEPPPPPVVATVDPAPPTELGSDIPAVASASTAAAGAARIGIAPMAASAIPLATGPYNMVLEGTTVTSDTSAALWIYGGIANVSLTGSTMTGTAAGALYSSTRPATSTLPAVSATTTLDADHSVINGRVFTDATSTTALNLLNGSVWNVTSNSNLTDLSNSNSLIDFPVTAALTADPTAAASYRTVVLTGAYVGDGGTIILNTWVADDDSPSDRLVINGGSASGQTLLQIRNSGGGGAQTLSNGILVVEAANGGITTADAFAMADELRVGAYSYALLRGAIDGSSTDSWYLRSSFVVPPPPPPPPPPTPPPPPPTPPPPPPPPPIPPPPPPPTPPPAPGPDPEPELPVDPPPEPLPPGTYPIIGPEVATYGVVQPTARQMGLATLGTLHERIGDTLTTANAQGSPSGPAHSAWARAFGEDIDNRYRSYTDPRTDGQLFGAQAGIDLWQRGEADAHRDAAGGYLAYARSDVDVTGLVTNEALTDYELVHTGQVRLTGKSAGLYWTHYGPAGGYLDGVAQWTRYSGRASTRYANIDTRGDGWAVSLEGGYPIPLSWGPSFILEPQAQVVWQRVRLDDTADEYGDVALGRTSGTSARIGLRGQWTITREDGEIWQPYVRANLWRDFSADAMTVYAGRDRVPLETRTTRVDASVGVTARLSDTVSVYGQLGYQTGVESGHQQREGIFGDVGLRWRW